MGEIVGSAGVPPAPFRGHVESDADEKPALRCGDAGETPALRSGGM